MRAASAAAQTAQPLTGIPLTGGQEARRLQLPARQRYPAGDVPNSVVVADLNGDGGPEGAAGKAYTIAAGVDTHDDDLAACGPGDLLTLTCFNALGNDDTDPFDNRVVRRPEGPSTVATPTARRRR